MTKGTQSAPNNIYKWPSTLTESKNPKRLKSEKTSPTLSTTETASHFTNHWLTKTNYKNSTLSHFKNYALSLSLKPWLSEKKSSQAFIKSNSPTHLSKEINMSSWLKDTLKPSTKGEYPTSMILGLLSRKKRPGKFLMNSPKFMLKKSTPKLFQDSQSNLLN